MGRSLYATVRASGERLPIRNTPPVSVMRRLRVCCSHLVPDIVRRRITDCSGSVLTWSTYAIATGRNTWDLSYALLFPNSDENDSTGLDSLPLNYRQSLRERIEHIEYIVSDSSKSQLLNQQSSSSSKILVQDTNKGSSSEQDIDDLHRCIKRKVFGRDNDLEDICRKLREGPDAHEPSSSSSKPYSVIGIYGITGSGKTTLAQYVCDYERDEGKHFDNIMFVHVSETFRVVDIFRVMLEQMTQKRPSETEDPRNLQMELKSKLQNSRFLLVLDDVWVNDGNRRQRDILLDVLDAGKNGSRVLVTAQNIDAAIALGAQELIQIPDLKEEECLSIFMDHALQGIASFDDRKHTEIGRKIVKKLRSSPLAAVTVAARLRMNLEIDFWDRTAKHDLLNWTMGALWWSYRQLDADIRRCFEYCITFPRGYMLERDELVGMWVAQGFVKHSNQTEDLEDVGQRYVDELLKFSFMNVQVAHYKKPLIIHDMLHKLAEWVSGSDFYRINLNGSQRDIPTEVRHLFIEIRNLADITDKILELENLRTLVIIEEEYPAQIFTKKTAETEAEAEADLKENILENMFLRLTKLRVLIVKIALIGKLVFPVPASIGQMKHLRYLSLRSFDGVVLNFPSTFRKLYLMQILDVWDFHLSSPEDIVNLIHLRRIWKKFDFVNDDYNQPDEMTSFFSVCKEKGQELHQLKHLNELRGSLVLDNLKHVRNKEEALEAKLACKKSVTKLVLLFHGEVCNWDADVEAEVLEGLCPMKDLVELQIWDFRGSRYPGWMMLGSQNPDAPKHLRELHLCRCIRLASIPEDNEFFKCLRVLCFHWCYWDNLPDNMESLKSLRRLGIVYCNRIEFLPTLPDSLEHIWIISINSLSKSCEEEGSPNWDKIQHIRIKTLR
ncbi:hypothetical protein SEVIR_6G019900v4 [Setaria viridis]|uniref:AAA+ ATPase domain-containing protein n=1 Tax=Setaria viridis TaxID=4556 RepID=A0A4U6TZ35_SETVI|nr:putative disease resistance RPP13-like protein 1 [Setaria viridis]TKW08290.1 hypothetical protein SEVIR_6G019900v2 [Setaria viridis]